MNRILDAARDVIISRGLEHATVQDIADTADLGKHTFFLYFRTKEHVIPALLQRAGTVYQQALDRALNGESVVKLLEELTTNHVAFGLNHWAFFRSQLLAVLAKDDIRELSMQCLMSNHDRMDALLAIGQERGEIRRDCSAADLARMAQQAELGAKLLASLDQRLPTTADVIASQRLVLALIRPPLEPAPASTRRGRVSDARANAPLSAGQRRSRKV